jgi:hypothetical protein
VGDVDYALANIREGATRDMLLCPNEITGYKITKRLIDKYNLELVVIDCEDRYIMRPITATDTLYLFTDVITKEHMVISRPTLQEATRYAKSVPNGRYVNIPLPITPLDTSKVSDEYKYVRDTHYVTHLTNSVGKSYASVDVCDYTDHICVGLKITACKDAKRHQYLMSKALTKLYNSSVDVVLIVDASEVEDKTRLITHATATGWKIDHNFSSWDKTIFTNIRNEPTLGLWYSSSDSKWATGKGRTTMQRFECMPNTSYHEVCHLNTDGVGKIKHIQGKSMHTHI